MIATPHQHHHRIMSRAVTLVLAVGFAVVGLAGAASAHHNTITGSVACATGGGWTVKWSVVNSEADKKETITASNRSVVPVGTMFNAAETKTFTETVTTKPAATVMLTLSANWPSSGVNQTNSGSIAAAAFADNCAVKIVTAPTVPVLDECGPGNAVFGQVPTGPWTSVLNPDRSLTVTANPGYSFGNGQTTVTFAAPTDSNQPCPVVTPPVVTPPVVTPPVVVPPVVTPPEVLPAEVKVVRAAARQIDKCGRASDLFKVAKRSGVIYKAHGKVLRQGVWIKSKTRTVTVRAKAADAAHTLKGKQTWKLTFTRKSCAQVPEVAPHTGA